MIILRLARRRLGFPFDPQRGHAPTTGDEDDVEQDIAPGTEEVAFFSTTGIGKEEGEDADKERGKKKARDKKRRLVYDEKLGEVVAERRRKPSRRGGWLDYEEDE